MNEQFIDSEQWFNYKEFYDFISKKKYKTLVEVGVWKGSSISYLASNNVSSKVYAVDLFESSYRYKKGYLKKEVSEIYKTYNTQLEKTKTRDIIIDIKDYSWDAATKFDDHSIDFVFIDADHSYESVRKDLHSWFKKVRPGGIFSGHDYEPYGENNHPGVKQAVDEFSVEKNLDLKTFSGAVWYFEI